MFKKSKIKPPKWWINGPTELKPFDVDGRKYLYGFSCEAHRCPNRIIFLYDPEDKKAVGLYIPLLGNNIPGKEIWLNNPSESQKLGILHKE